MLKAINVSEILLFFILPVNIEKSLFYFCPRLSSSALSINVPAKVVSLSREGSLWSFTGPWSVFFL